MSKPKEYAWMTQNKLMTYTLVALVILLGVSFFSWGITPLIIAAVAVLVAVGIDTLLAKVTVDSPLNTMSAAVFGLIVALSYSLGEPTMTSMAANLEVLPLTAPYAYVYAALISAVGMTLFKKLQGLAGRKYVNPAATAKMLIFLPFLNTVFLALGHLRSGALQVPALAGPIGYTVIGNNGGASFAGYILSCFSNPAVTQASPISWLLIVQKFHGWVGGASSLAVIIVGTALFIVCRRFIKWRITLAYLVTVTLMALLMTVVYGGDMYLRIGFELFIGSSIFLAFFMATDPATTPLTYAGQTIFGVGLGVLTVLIQTYMNFFGGSILALIVMNLTTPLLDKVGLLKPSQETKEPTLPRAQQFTKVITRPCIRCGMCMRLCCHKLSPILIKQAFDKNNFEQLTKLKADYCTACGHCTYVCPARIDLRNSVLRAKAALHAQK
jgi:electron transport complex protein RnfD